MQNAETLLAEGLAHQKSGRTAMAGLCYESLRKNHPDYPGQLYTSGLTAYREGRHDDAIVALGAVVAIHPQLALLHYNLGIVCTAANKPEFAERCLARAAELDHTHSAIFYTLGVIRLRLGCPDTAEIALRAALRLSPSAADAQAALGVALLRLGRREQAEAAWREAEALPHDNHAAENGLGLLCAELGQLSPAETHYQAALRHDPHDAGTWTNLAKLLRDTGRFREAIEASRHAIDLQPGHPDTHCTLAHALTAAGRLDEAEQSYAAALAIDPAHAESHYHRGLTHLLGGRLALGWEGFAWRWRRRGYAPPHVFNRPEWTGEPAGEATLLLHCEQGSGDTIQMARYISAVAAHSRVILLVQRGLERLMARIPGVTAVFTEGEALPDFAAHYPLMSLPGLCGTTIETIPADIPYLQPDPADVARWQRRVASLDGLRVGLAWAGNPRYRADGRRSIPAERFGMLRGLLGIDFVSLQKHGAALDLPIYDWTADLHDFADTAALIACLDLVIAVDTAVAHLAGALGKPVWLLNRFDPCWRWMLGRADSPWYPTLHQFRQPAPGDWDSVLAAVRTALTGETP